MPIKRAQQFLKRLLSDNAVLLGHDDKSVQISTQALRVPISSLPIELTIGSETETHCTLLIRTMVRPDTHQPNPTVRIESMNLDDVIPGSISLSQGRALILGNHHAQQAHIFGYPKTWPKKVIRVTYGQEALLLKNLLRDPATTITLSTQHTPESSIVQRVKQTQNNLQRLKSVFDFYPRSLPRAPALTLLQTVNAQLKFDSDRPLNSLNQPGAVVMLPTDLIPIILGDLHARPENLITLLAQDGYLEALEQGRGVLVILGDAVHPEAPQDLTQMERSVLIFDLILTLKAKFPEVVHYIRGNHDSFAPHVTKGGIPQGSLWKAYLQQVRGDDYVAEVERYYQQLPYVVMARYFVACHAGPPLSKGLSLQQLIDAGNDPSLIKQITSQRLKGPHAPVGYTRRDIAKFRKALDLTDDFPLIVSHNPLGRVDTLWFNAAKIPGYHIVFSAHPDQLGVITQVREVLVPQIFTPYSMAQLGENWEGSTKSI